MLRKRLAILFFTIAQVIILGHGVVSHHHSDDLSFHIHHGQAGDDIHHSADENPLALAFSGFLHAGEHITFTNSDTTKVVVAKDVVKSTKALPSYFAATPACLFTFQKRVFPPDRQRTYKSPQSGTLKLRGPPLFIVA